MLGVGDNWSSKVSNLILNDDVIDGEFCNDTYTTSDTEPNDQTATRELWGVIGLLHMHIARALIFWLVFSERELTFTFAICHRPSVCRLSVCRLSSVTFVHPTHAIEIFDNVSTPCGTLVIFDLCMKILRRSSQGNPSVGGVKHKRGSRI